MSWFFSVRNDGIKMTKIVITVSQFDRYLTHFNSINNLKVSRDAPKSALKNSKNKRPSKKEARISKQISKLLDAPTDVKKLTNKEKYERMIRKQRFKEF